MIGPWRPRFACPECRTPVTHAGDRAACHGCGRTFEREGRLFRFLAPHRRDAAEPHLRQYRAMRAHDGYHALSPEDYRMLPATGPADPRAGEWRVRSESYEHLRQYGLGTNGHGRARILDLGAGNGWLSHRLAALGHSLVAVDRLDDDDDGLGVCRHYPVDLAVVQADFDALPFEPAQFDVAVFDASLHYSADPAATLAEAVRTLSPGGAIVVMDSPMFWRRRDGMAMLADERRRMKMATGADVRAPGVGFLTFEMLDGAAAALGRRTRFVPSRGPLDWRIRRSLSRLRLRRSPAAFGVWVAR